MRKYIFVNIKISEVMLKKIVHISVIILLIAYTMGIYTYRHYCGATLVSQTVLVEPNHCCGSHCPLCHDKVSFFKISDSFEKSIIDINFKSEFNKILSSTFFSNMLQVPSLKDIFTSYLFYKVKTCENHPPTKTVQFVLLQSFRL